MACITEVMTSQMEKFGQQDPVESTIDELLNTVSASEFNADLDVSFLFAVKIILFLELQILCILSCFYFSLF